MCYNYTFNKRIVMMNEWFNCLYDIIREKNNRGMGANKSYYLLYYIAFLQNIIKKKNDRILIELTKIN